MTALDADERYPDSVFVEDTAVVTERGARSSRTRERRKGGERSTRSRRCWSGALRRTSNASPTPVPLDGGDVLQVRDHFYVGLIDAERIREGAEQLSAILHRYGFGVSLVELRRFLHLKTGVAYLGGDDVRGVPGSWWRRTSFEEFDKIVVACRRGIRRELHPGQRPRSRGRRVTRRSRRSIAERGYEVTGLEMSEFRKLDGGLSCLSLRLPELEL